MSLKISSDGELLVSGSADGTVLRCRSSTGEALGRPLRGHNFWINYSAVSEDGNGKVSCSDEVDKRLWDTFSGEVIGIL